ncbi:uncharacterized protein [Ptychodera flava]|uniref:uncharacterized protein n=1 Tax=Ptychodera flava TaxID=63121 RepID=UPI003969F2FD
MPGIMSTFKSIKRCAKFPFCGTSKKFVSNVPETPEKVTSVENMCSDSPRRNSNNIKLSAIIPRQIFSQEGRQQCCTPNSGISDAKKDITPVTPSSTTFASDHTYCKPVNNTQTALSVHKAKNELDEVKVSNKEYDPVLYSLKDLSSSPKPDQSLLSQSEMFALIASVKTQSAESVAAIAMKIPNVASHIMNLMAKKIDDTARNMGNRKHGFVSYLMKKDFNSLKSFSWTEVIGEAIERFPEIIQLVVACALPMEKRSLMEKLKDFMPRLGLMYAILMQTRIHDLSKVQRVMSMLLQDHLTDQKIFDRLQKVGVCLSYTRSRAVIEEIGGHFNAEMIDAIKSGKRIRLVGDNSNYRVGVHDERIGKHSTMHHDFASAAIVQLVNFDKYSNLSPQLDYLGINHQSFLMSDTEATELKMEYVIHIARVAVRVLPCFQFLKTVIPEHIVGKCSQELAKKSKVIPLPVLVDCNEQNYSDVVQILEFYEETLNDVYTKADIPFDDKVKVHIGGDQLTRDRFSGAKRLRIGGATAMERFDHLSPITFEFFHMQMNYLQVFYKVLYKENSVQEIGTMRSEQQRILRRTVTAEVQRDYDADAEFAISFIDAYITEALMEYFGLETTNSTPTRNRPPPDLVNADDCRMWMNSTFLDLIDQFVWPKKEINLSVQAETVIDDGSVVTMKLADGTSCVILLQPKQMHREPTDYVKNYGHTVLELGLLFKSMCDMCKLPDRDRGIRILKMAMVIFKSSNNLSKYALEIIRLLVHQLCILSEREALEEFYGLFVNTKGKIDSFIPADRQMEYIIKLVKSNIKHMYSNKTESNIKKVTSAIAGISDIAENFDKSSRILVRGKKHSAISAQEDEMAIIEDLRKIRPFQCLAGRYHPSFAHISNTIQDNLDRQHFYEWIDRNIVKFATEFGK